jgi:hypothetical protein
MHDVPRLTLSSEPLDTVEAIVAEARLMVREATRPVESPEAEPTPLDLERLGKGEGGSVIVAGRYRVDRLLGRGGMASVFAAHDLTLDVPVALKVLSDDYGGHPRILARFLREARLNARLRHPNIVELLDSGSTRTGVIYLAMELLEGEDLRQTLAREHTLPWPRVRALMLDLCAGLGAAHAAGIVHRDLKPSNCFRVTTGTSESMRLVDFGIATDVGATAAGRGDGPEHRRLTLDDRVVGTPEYMSPEQARGEQVDHRSDIYAAALILGEMLTGSLPFSATTPAAMLAAQIYERPAHLADLAPRGVFIPDEVAAIQARALRKDPNERYPDIEAFAAALREVDPEAGRPRWFDLGVRRWLRRATSSRAWPWAAAAAAVTFMLGTLGGGAVVGAVGWQAPVAVEAKPAVEVPPLRPLREISHEPAPSAVEFTHPVDEPLDPRLRGLEYETPRAAVHPRGAT